MSSAAEAKWPQFEYRGVEIHKVAVGRYEIYSEGGRCYQFPTLSEAHAFVDAAFAMSLFGGRNVAVAPESGVIEN